MSDNKHLKRAHKAKNDEFYTRYEDVKKYFDPVKRLPEKIYCPFDSAQSAFVRYFQERGCQVRYTPNDGRDWFAEDHKEDLAWCDIVITNPPFSRLREFIDVLDSTLYPRIVQYHIIVPVTYFSTIQSGRELLHGRRVSQRGPSHFSNTEKTVGTYWFGVFMKDRKEYIPTYTADNYPHRVSDDGKIIIDHVKDIPSGIKSGETIYVPINAVEYMYHDYVFTGETYIPYVNKKVVFKRIGLKKI